MADHRMIFARTLLTEYKMHCAITLLSSVQLTVVLISFHDFTCTQL